MDVYEKFDQCLGSNWSMFQAALVTIIIILIVGSVMKMGKSNLNNPPKFPSPGIGLGTSNVMGFYQGFDQLWGPGSSSYAAPDKDYLMILQEDPKYRVRR